MADERWVVELASRFIDCWYPMAPLYVSEEVARLAIKHVWKKTYPKSTLRVNSVDLY